MSLVDDTVDELAGLHERLKALLRVSPHAGLMSAVTIVSMNDDAAGQWILGQDDRATVIRRLRLCADILEAMP